MKSITKYIKGDKVIWFTVFLLCIASVLTVYSSIVTLAFKYRSGDTEYYLFEHGKIIILGLGIMYLTHLIPHRYYSRISQIALYLVIPLLLYTLLKGTNLNQADRWLTLPIINKTFQPSEIAKLVLIIYVARILAKKQDQIKDFKGAFLPIIVPVITICALIMPADFSTAAILFATCVILMFIGRINMKYIGIMIGMMGLAMAFLILIMWSIPEETLRDKGRVLTWKHRIENFASGEEKANFQAEQSKIAIAMGGIPGQGPGKSVQRNFLPHPYSDFIFAIVIEEYGLIGASFLILLYLILLFRGIKIATILPNSFGSFLAVGCCYGIVFQALINMAVAVNIFPVTGQTLPLISKGGTSIWFTCIALGMILSVSREVVNEKNEYVNASA
ncbi:MAG: FtsW/RodA/SpoVE family cell cycle protein [Flavobacteriales bacterium]|nr:FtsW/RodA/SpoVE family cell cycle protein [Flavobacteriales bacterium]